MANSRLKKHLKNQAVKNIALAAGGIILIILFLIVFGSKILIGFSILAGKFNNDNVVKSSTQNTTYVEPPTLNPSFDATNSATTIITGTGLPKQIIKLYKNDDSVAQTDVNNDNTFTFKDVALSDGKNIFKVKALTPDNRQSDYSSEVTISRESKQPSLNISFPSDGQTVKKDQSPIQVKGTTDQGIKVTVNDFWAIVNDSGSFNYNYTLQDGDNTLKFVATDQAGNTTTKEIKIHVE